MRMRLRWAFDAALESFWFLPLLMVALYWCWAFMAAHRSASAMQRVA